MGFLRQEYWTELPFPSPGDLPDLGLEPIFPPLQVDSLLLNHWGMNQPIHLVPAVSDGKASAYSVGNLGSIPGSGRSPGEGNGNPFQYSCLENPMARGAWWATVHGVVKSQTGLND